MATDNRNGTASPKPSTGRLPTADEQAGMDWWNSLIEELACDLEEHVAGAGYNLVTAIQACAETAMRHAKSASDALDMRVGANGGAA